MSLPRRGLSAIAGPLLLVGAVCVIGMCVIDFVFWALPPELDGPVYDRLSAAPSVWRPFMRFGANELFVAALVAPALGFWGRSRAGLALVAVGAATMAIGTQWFNVAGYAAMIAGYALGFRRQNAARAG